MKMGVGQGSKCSCGGDEQAITETINMPWTHAVMLTDALPARFRWERLPSPDFKLDSPEPSQGTVILLMEWKGEGAEQKEIFVAEPT